MVRPHRQRPLALIAVLVVLTGTFAACASASSPSAHSTGTPSSVAPRAALPGQQTWRNGVSSYLFGTNDTIEYGSPNVGTLPSVQNLLKQGGLTLMRTWIFSDMSDADIERRIQTIQASGMQCMAMLGNIKDVSFLQHAVTLLGDRCNIYEFGNEEDSHGTSDAQYLQYWNTVIPKLRAISPKAVFGGPTSSNPYVEQLAAFMQGTNASGVLPDFISYHHYPCYGVDTEQHCIDMTTGAYRDAISHIRSLETKYLGHTVPTGVTEWNFDPGSANLYSWGKDGAFMFQWTQTALSAFVGAHLDFANQFTTLNYSGYGLLDMFDDSAPYGAKQQFNSMVASVKMNGGPSTLAVP